MKFKPFQLSIWLILFFWIYFYSLYSNFENKKIITKNQIITIKKWENLSNLYKKIWLDNFPSKYIYKIYIKLDTPENFKLKAWKYKLKENSTIKDIFNSLKKPITNTENLTFLEWWNIYDIDNYLEKKWLIKSGEFIKKTEKFQANPEVYKKLIKKYPFLKKAKTLEWFLYPDTYEINPNNFSVDILINKMLSNFNRKVYTKYLTNYSDKEIIDIINLASIVEKEEKNSKNKPIVANILKKRWKENMMIWADITVCYPHKLTSNECKMVVSKYIKEKSEYNTRTKIWLPKTPISNPSVETISATINDKKTPYYFYLHNIKTWEIYYGKTNAEHEKNKRFMR